MLSLCVLYEDDSSFVLEEKKDRARVCGVCACIIETEERSAKECVRASPLLIRGKLFLSRTLYPEVIYNKRERL